MNDTEKFRHFSVINDFLRRHKDYTPSNREEYEKFKEQLLSLNEPLRNMGKGHAVWDMNKKIKELYKKVQKRFHAVERKERSKGLVDITSPKVEAYLDQFNLVKTAANTPLPQQTSHMEIEEEEKEGKPVAVSCKSCFGRRKTKKKGKKSYDEFYGGKRRRRKKKTRKKRGGNGKKKKGLVKEGIAETDRKGLPEYPYIQIDNPPKEWKMKGGLRKKKTRKKRGGKIVVKDIENECEKNDSDEDTGNKLCPVSYDELGKNGEYIVKDGENGYCFNYSSIKNKNGNFRTSMDKNPMNRNLWTPEFIRELDWVQNDMKRKNKKKENKLMRTNGRYWIQGDDFWQGDMTMESYIEQPCCTKCEPHGCMSALGCGVDKCSTCDENFQPTGTKKKCEKLPWIARGGRRKKKTRKKRGKGAIQSYFAREQPQRDYTWNVAQFNGDYDDFGAAQRILELCMRDDDFRSPEEEADHRSVYQRSIIDDYHNPDRRLWETLLRWMRLQTTREEQQQFFRNPPGGPPGPPGQIATPAAGGGRRKKKTRKKRGGEKSKKIKKLTKIFQQYPKIFPSGYFRFLAARLENHINKNTLWYRNGVVLTWIKYQKTVKKNDKCIIKPGDVKLDQIVNKNQGNGAAKKVVMQFLKKFEKNRVWLEVRANNKRAIRFYRKNGFKKVCNIKFGDIPGIMMVKN